jgi:large subunit ribosomal protein L13
MKIKTYVARPDDIERQWWVIDAEGQTLGRLASRIAPILSGKTKPIYTPNLDTGDYVIVINCDKLKVTGNRLEDKVYYRHSQYPGGIKSITLKDQLSGRFPERVIIAAVRGMLPKTSLGRAMIKKLKVYKGAEHPHAAQKPVVLVIK